MARLLPRWPSANRKGHHCFTARFPYKVLQGASHRRRRGSAFSVRVVKYWNKLPVSVVTVPSVTIFKKRLEKVWTEVFPHLPHWLNTHLPISLLPIPTCTPPFNGYHLELLPNSLFNRCGCLRPLCGPLITLITHNQLDSYWCLPCASLFMTISSPCFLKATLSLLYIGFGQQRMRPNSY